MKPVHRAYTLLDIKSVDAEQRVITGIASSASVDRMGDVVEPAGAEFELPIPLLWQHNSRQPIGMVTRAKVVGKTIEVTAQIAKDTGVTWIDEAWALMKAGLVRGLSIGFASLEESYDKETGGYHFLRWLWLELSAVTIPANADANITTIKSCDVGLVALDPASTRRSLPGASGLSRVVSMRTDRPMKKSYADQIAMWETTRRAKTDRMDAILAKSAEAEVTLDDAETEEHDTLEGEVAKIDATLARLRSAEAREKAAALPVRGDTAILGSESRGIIRVERKLPPGILFARYAMCQGASRGNPGEAMRLAQKHYPDDPGVLALIEKAPVAGASTSGSHNIDDMIPYNVMNDFIDFLRPGSIIGKFGGPNPGGGPNYPSLNRVGFNERVSGMSTGFVAAWKGEGLPALPTAAVTFNTSLTYNNMSALAVMTKEAIRFSNPAAEERVRNDLAKAVNYKLDVDFIDPAKAASGTTSPASITNAVVATGVTGATAATLVTDLATLLALFTTNNLDLSDVVLIMSASMALNISLMTTTLGMTYFPSLTPYGGSLRGIPVIVSENLTSLGSPSTGMIVAAKPSEIYLADDGVVTVEASDQASLEMQSTSSQTAISGTGASLVSLWQTGAVGLMATREITWKVRRSTAVQYISPAAYKA